MPHKKGRYNQLIITAFLSNTFYAAQIEALFEFLARERGRIAGSAALISFVTIVIYPLS